MLSVDAGLVRTVKPSSKSSSIARSVSVIVFG